MFGALLLFAAILLIVFALMQWSTPDNEYFKKRNIKYMDPKFMFRFAIGLFTNKYTATEFAQTLYQVFPDES